MKNFQIRKAIPNDAYGICFVNTHTWYTTYKGLIPNKFLENRINNIEEKAEKVHELIKNGGNYLVVEDTEKKEIIGMLIYGPSRNDKYPNSGEINAIYILPEHQKLGIGKKLFLAGIEELIKLGYKDMVINVLKGNNAINFYKKYGGKVVGERTDEIGEKKIKIYEDIIYFKDIESLYLTYNSKE